MATFSIRVCVLLLSICVALCALPDPAPPYPPPTDGLNLNGPYHRYDTVDVSIYVYHNYTKHLWRAPYFPRVDEFASLSVSYTAVPFFLYNPDIRVFFSFNGFNTSMKAVYSAELDVMLTYFTVIIQLDTNGVVTSVDWDDGCSNCLDNVCVSNQCGVPRVDKGTAVDCQKLDCTIKAYLAWAGKDASGQDCISFGSRPSAFATYSATDVEKFGTGLWGDVTYNIEANAPPPAF